MTDETFNNDPKRHLNWVNPMYRRNLISGIAGMIAITSGCTGSLSGGSGGFGGPDDFPGKLVKAGVNTDDPPVTASSLTGGFVDGKNFKYSGKIKSEVDRELVITLGEVQLFTEADNKIDWTTDRTEVVLSAGESKQITNTVKFYDGKPNESDIDRFQIIYYT